MALDSIATAPSLAVSRALHPERQHTDTSLFTRQYDAATPGQRNPFARTIRTRVPALLCTDSDLRPTYVGANASAPLVQATASRVLPITRKHGGGQAFRCLPSTLLPFRREFPTSPPVHDAVGTRPCRLLRLGCREPKRPYLRRAQRPGRTVLLIRRPLALGALGLGRLLACGLDPECMGVGAYGATLTLAGVDTRCQSLPAQARRCTLGHASHLLD